MKRILLVLTLCCSVYACENTPDNFISITSPKQFDDAIQKPALLYLHSKAWNLGPLCESHFSDPVHKQVIERLKELAGKNSDVVFAEMEWSENEKSNLSSQWLRSQNIRMLIQPFFLFYNNGQPMRQLYLNYFHGYPIESIKDDRSLYWAEMIKPNGQIEDNHIELRYHTCMIEGNIHGRLADLVAEYKYQLSSHDQ